MGRTLIQDLSGNQTPRLRVAALVCSSYVPLSAVWAMSLLLNEVTTVLLAYWVLFVLRNKYFNESICKVKIAEIEGF